MFVDLSGLADRLPPIKDESDMKQYFDGRIKELSLAMSAIQVRSSFPYGLECAAIHNGDDLSAELPCC